MSETTKIAWAKHTFNPWIGCTKVASGCANCYAEAMAGRLGVTWGPNGTRRRTAESTWKQVEKWNRQAMCTCGRDSAWGISHIGQCPQKDRPRVFPSLCDIFEDWDMHVETPKAAVSMADVRRDFFALIDRTPNLDWLLLTKRPKNIGRMWCSHVNTDGKPPSQLHRKNVWLLYSASDQASLDAGLPHLLACRDLVPVLGLSLEPLTGPVDLRRVCVRVDSPDSREWRDSLTGTICTQSMTHGHREFQTKSSIDWVIVGGESGPRARPCNVEWLRSIVSQCREAGVPCFVKQFGARVVWNPAQKWESWPDQTRIDYESRGIESLHRVLLRDPKGGDLDEWPFDIRVREFPER